MALYANYHTDYIRPGCFHEIDNPYGIVIVAADNPREAFLESIKDEPTLKNGACTPDDMEDETAIINLDKLFEAMRAAGYGVTITPPEGK